MINKMFHKAVLSKEKTIQEVIKNLSVTNLQICFICEKQKLLGTVTDGDIRRAILKKINLDQPVKKIMNTDYVFVDSTLSIHKARKLMKLYKLNQIPVINKKKILINVFFSETIDTSPSYENPVIIMAGGFGKRLYPMTKNCPKPLLPIVGKPVLEHIINKLKNEGFHNIYISIHYLGNMIKEYFGNGKKFDVNIKYINEDNPLGTAGCISKFESINNKDFLVCNGDVLTDISFAQLLEYHLAKKSTATMAVRKFFWQHPFGVIKTNGIKIKTITEKPIEESYVNAGIYVFKNDVIKLVKKNKKFEMPALFRKIKNKKFKTIIFPMFENWLDIGDAKEYEKAQKKFI